MAVKVINKIIATEQDLSFGEGKISQQRGGVTLSLDKINTVKVVSDISVLSNLSSSDQYVDPDKFSVVKVKGYTTENDGGEGLFYWDKTANIIDEDLGTAFISGISPTTGLWRRLNTETGQVNAKWFGVKGDGVTDDTDAMNRVVEYINNNENSTLYIPKGTYILKNTLDFSAADNVIIRGEGRQSTKLKFVGNVSPGIKLNTGSEVHIDSQYINLSGFTMVTDNLTSTAILVLSSMSVSDVVRAGLLEHLMFVGENTASGWFKCIHSQNVRGLTVQHSFAIGPNGGSSGNAFWHINNTITIGTDYYTYFNVETVNYENETLDLVPSGGNIQSIIADGSITEEKLAASVKEVIGTIKEYGGLAVPTGYLECDGTAYSRNTYAELFTAITLTQSGSRTSGSGVVTGLSDTTKMAAGMYVSGTGIPAGTTIATVDSSTQITLSQNSTATTTGDIVVAPWGIGDGTTTFNVPNLSRRATIGRGGTATGTVGNAVGATGGEEDHTLTIDEIPAHTHIENGFAATMIIDGTGAGVSFIGSTATGNSTGSAGGDQVHNNMQPSAVVMKIIKY